MKCPNCDNNIFEIYIGKDNPLKSVNKDITIYMCTKCGRLEFYMPDSWVKKKEEERKREEEFNKQSFDEKVQKALEIKSLAIDIIKSKDTSKKDKETAKELLKDIEVVIDSYYENENAKDKDEGYHDN